LEDWRTCVAMTVGGDAPTRNTDGGRRRAYEEYVREEETRPTAAETRGCVAREQQQRHVDEGGVPTAQRGRGVKESVNSPVGRVGQRQCR